MNKKRRAQRFFSLTTGLMLLSLCGCSDSKDNGHPYGVDSPKQPLQITNTITTRSSSSALAGIRFLLKGEPVATFRPKPEDKTYFFEHIVKTPVEEGSVSVELWTADGWRTRDCDVHYTDGSCRIELTRRDDKYQPLQYIEILVDNRKHEAVKVRVGQEGVDVEKDTVTRYEFLPPATAANAVITVDGSAVGRLWDADADTWHKREPPADWSHAGYIIDTSGKRVYYWKYRDFSIVPDSTSANPIETGRNKPGVVHRFSTRIHYFLEAMPETISVEHSSKLYHRRLAVQEIIE